MFLLCTVLQVSQNPNSVNTNNKFYFNPVGVFCELYNVQFSGKHENVMKEMYWNNYYLVPGLEYQYVGNCNNNAPYFQCGNAWWYGGYTHIAAISMSCSVS